MANQSRLDPRLLSVKVSSDFNCIRELAVVMKSDSPVVFLLGAGISIDAGIPAAGRIVKILRTKFPARVRTWDYAGAMKAAFPKPNAANKRRQFIEDLCVGRIPTIGHYALAHLADAGHVRAVFTTNFDRLADVAFTSTCSRPIAIYAWEEDVDLTETHDGSVAVVKLHGDFLTEKIANLPQELKRRLSRRLRLQLREFLSGAALVAVGYSGSDRSVMSWLIKVARERDCSIRGVWWIDPAKLPSDRVRSLALTLRKQGKSFYTIGLKSTPFFKRLCQELGVTVLAQRWHLGHGAYHAWLRPKSKPFPPSRPQTAPRSKKGLLDKIVRRARAGGSVWITAPPGSEKSSIAAELYNSQFVGRCFYYSARFGRNFPLVHDLTLRLDRFCEEQGIEPEDRWRYARLFRSECVVIIDDFDSKLMEEHPEFVNRLTLLHLARRSANAGLLVFFSSEDPSERFLAWTYAQLTIAQHTIGSVASKRIPGIESVSTENGMELRIQAGAALSPSHVGFEVISTPVDSNRALQSAAGRFPNKRVLTTLGRLANLRFAETPETLSFVIGETIRKILREPTVSLYFDQSLGRLVLRDSVRDSLLTQKSSTASRNLVAARLARLTNDPGMILNSLHFLIEAFALGSSAAFAPGSSVKEVTARLEVSHQLGDLLSRQRYPLDAIEILTRTALECDKLRSASRVPGVAWYQVADSLRVAWDAIQNGRAIDLACYEGPAESRVRIWRLSMRQDGLAFGKSVLSGILGRRLSALWDRLLHVPRLLEQSHHQVLCTLKAVAALARNEPSLSESANASLAVSAWALELWERSDNADLCARALILAENESLRAGKGFQKLGDGRNAAFAFDHLATIALRTERYQGVFRRFSKVRRILSRAQGVDRNKAVNYHGLFVSLLKLGKWKKAEGFFYESNLHYQATQNLDGVARNLATLLDVAISQSGSRFTSLPEPPRIFQAIENLLRETHSREVEQMVSPILHRYSQWLDQRSVSRGS
jgi:SIR2-like domain